MIRRKASLCLALALLACAVTATLAAPPAAAPGLQLPAGIEKRASVEGITEYALPNGLRVLLFPDPSKQQTTVNVTYLVGSRHEGYGESGMAHLLEHMVFKGTPKHKDIPQELTAHGTRPNGSTWYDRTNYFETFAATDENLDWALDLEADRMVNSFIAKKDLDSEMTVVRNEFEIGENSPQGVLQERAMSTAYLWHNYGKSTIGSRADLERVPIDSLQAFYKKWYQPDNAILVVAGKFDEARTLQKIAETFGKIPRPSRPLPQTWTEEPAQDGEREVTLRRVGDIQAVTAMYHVPAGSHADFPAVDLLSFILGDTPSGRLYKALVETKKASSASAYAFQLKEPGLLAASAEVRTDASLEEAKDILIKVTEEAASKAPTAEEVSRARDSRLKNWETTLRSSERAAIRLSEWAAMGDWRLMFLHRDRLKEVKPEDVQRVAQAYLKPQNRTVGLFIPTKEAMRAEVPSVPDVAALVKDYKGGEALSQGEAFDPTPAVIEGRTQRVTLDPGIKLVLLSKKTRGSTVQVGMTFHHGDEASLQGRSTAASMAGGMLMRGTTKHTRQQIRDEIDRLKAQLSVFGGATQATASIETTRENLAGAIQLAAEILREPAFPESEFELLRQERLAGLEDAKSDPGQKASTALAKHLNPWPKSDPRYVESPEETIEALKAVSLEEARKFYADFYGGSTGEIAIVGDFDPAEMQVVVSQAFAGWKSPRPFTRLASSYQDRPALRTSIEAPDKESAVFLAGLRVEMRDDAPDYPAMVLGNFMTGGGFLNSRLATRIRRNDGLSYGVGSFFFASAFDKDAQFGARAIYAPQNADKLVAAFQEEIAKVLDKGFTADEIAEAKKGWLQGRQVSRSNDRELVRTLTQRAFEGRTLAWDEEIEKKIAGLTNDPIQAAMKKVIQPEKISFVQSGDFSKVKKDATPGAPK
ncbi:MAG TPA: pitrilysin family protein [Candidatus Polarisedimenticolaceae bacterium]|nr:pitrilysin family protein [Candidatus Polarisedimenticolaceae bacterium]